MTLRVPIYSEAKEEKPCRRYLTWSPHFDPVGQLLSTGEPAFIAGVAYHSLQLLMAHKACEERQVDIALCHRGLVDPLQKHEEIDTGEDGICLRPKVATVAVCRSGNVGIAHFV